MNPVLYWVMWRQSNRIPAYGENDNLGALPFLSVTANLNNKDLGTATKDVKAAIQSLGEIAARTDY